MLNNIFFKKITTPNTTIATTDAELYKLENISLLESFTNSTNELNNASVDFVSEFTMGILEDSSDIIFEAFGDYTQKIKKFFEDIIKNLKEFVGRSIQYMQTKIGQTKQLIRKHGEELKRGNYNFYIDGYKYTTDDASPNADILDDIIKEYNSELSKITSIEEDDIRERRKKITDGEFTRKVKSRVLCTTENVGNDDFAVFCRKHFRNGETNTESINITNKEVNEVIDSYNKLDKSVSEMVKTKNRLSVQFRSLENFFTNGAVSLKTSETGAVTVLHELSKGKGTVGKGKDKENIDTSDASLTKLNTYLSYRLLEAKEVSNIIMTVVDAKCKALQMQINQSDKIIGKCIFGNKPEKDGDNNDK